MKTQKRTFASAAAILASLIAISSIQAAPVAWWRFEEGPAGAQVDDGGFPGATFYPAIADSSGNGNALSVWDEGGAGYIYRTEVASTVLPLTGDPNNFSVKNSGGGPAMFTETGGFLQTWQPATFTIEATFKLENGGFKTIVGRDSMGATSNDGNLAAMYFQAVPNNGLAIKFADVSGYWHEAVSAENAYTGFDFGTDPDGSAAPWYSMAAVSDGATLSLYLRNVTANSGWDLIAQDDLTLSGSTDTTLTMGTGDGGDWDAGNFSVGRGLYAGGHGDRAYGFVDEVRLTEGALAINEFVFVPEPTSTALVALGVGALMIGLRRRRMN